jgi:DNA primase
MWEKYAPAAGPCRKNMRQRCVAFLRSKSPQGRANSEMRNVAKAPKKPYICFMISKETIDAIKDTARIEEVVGDFVMLKRRGVNMLGRCPFHNEKTPSFTVSPAKGIYKCFGCGVSGDSIKFIMEHEHFSYPEALRYVAQKYNIQIEETEASPEYMEEQSAREALFVVNQFAENHFIQNLWEHEMGNAVGLSYFHERGFDDATIKKFKLGFAIEEWDYFLKKATEAGYKLEYLKTLGLVTSGERTVDMYRGRVIFPIHNLSGRVVGFGARILKTNEKAPKYINSPENDIYQKSKIVYGIFYAKTAIVKNNKCYLVEGYTDVISLHQAGVENVVASSGTSLTTGQIELIKRYTPNITILYDGDAAGIKASFRGIDMILENGMNVKVVLFPDGEDPDSYAKNHSQEELEQFIRENENDFIRFKASVLMKDAANDPILKAAAIKDIVNSIALVPDGILRTLYVQQCSDLMNVPEHTLNNELNKIRRELTRNKLRKDGWQDQDIIPAPNQEYHEKQVEEIVFTAEPHEKEILRLLLNYADKVIQFEQLSEEGSVELVDTTVGNYITQDILTDEITFNNPLHQLVFDEICELVAQHKYDGLSQYFLHHTDEEISKFSIDLLSMKYEVSENWLKEYNIVINTEESQMTKTVFNILYNFKAAKLEQMIDSLRKRLKDSTEDDSMELLTDINDKQMIKKSLSDQLSVVIWK